MITPDIVCLNAAAPEETTAIAEHLGARLTAGDVVLLHGPVGAGKSHFARALIQSRLATHGRTEDIPSPTFTLVQSYDLPDCEIWHADLYRLSDPQEAIELGLDQAFEDAICLVEWPERLGALAPHKALHLSLLPQPAETARKLAFSATDPAWEPRLRQIFGSDQFGRI